MKSAVSAFATILSMALSTPVAAETISPAQAATRVGKMVTVEGAVDQVYVSRKRTIFLNFGGAFPNQLFFATIFADSSSLFGNVLTLEGRSVAITGIVELYKGKPEIILDSPQQLVAE